MYQYEIRRDFVRPDSYFRGWRDPEQDRKPPPKVASIVSQDYEFIKKECLAQGVLWEDPSFPATNQSLYPSRLNVPIIKWLRPKDICTDPQMAVDGFTRFDVQQGTLKDCWFLAALASLCATENKELFHQVVPQDNVFDSEYAGVFHFWFWQYGKWVHAVVDDQLPTKDGRLLFAHSTTQNEFWPALLEKAYAKLNGSYEVLQSGSSTEAMQDFTGGVTEIFDFQTEVPKDLFTTMRKAFERDSLMGCAIGSKNDRGDARGRLRNGLVTSHSFSITSVKEITVRGRKIGLIRVRNPWADETEWNGSWSDGSSEWKDLSEADKRSLGLVTFDKDGEFWMSYEDFVSNFTLLHMCSAAPTSSEVRTSRGGGKIKWEMTAHEGSWTRYVNAGGRVQNNNYACTFWTNPRYTVQLVAPDEDEQDKGTLIVSLIQKDRRKQIAKLGDKMLSIGVSIYRIPDSHVGPLNSDFRCKDPAVAFTGGVYIKDRERVGRFKLPLGNYLVIPSTYDPNCEADFLLRIFSEERARSDEIDPDTRLIDRPDLKLAVTQDDRDEERDIKELFRRTAGSDLEVDAYELRTILDSKLRAEFNIEGVSLETARSMLALMDIDHSGKLGYDEFKHLWTDLRHWKKVFLQYDVSKTNSLSSYELRTALESSGCVVNNHTFHCLVMRYSDQKGFVQFDDFLLCVTRLKTLLETFQSLFGKGQVAFSLDQIIQTAMYA